MQIKIKPGRSRTINGLRIVNADKHREIRLILEPAKRLTVEPEEAIHHRDDLPPCGE